MSRITKEEIEKTKCGRFLLSDENIYLSIYSLNSYVFEYNLLNIEDRILYHRLQDKFDARLINGVITRVREQIIELIDKDKYIEAKVYFKPKKLSENGELEFRPLHSTGLITQIAIVSMLHLFVYEIPEEEEGDPKLRLSNLSRLIPSDFYGNRVSVKPEYLFKPWKQQYQKYNQNSNDALMKYHTSLEYKYEVTLDLENFFPTINPIIIYHYVINHLPAYLNDEEREMMKRVLQKLLFCKLTTTFDEKTAKQYYKVTKGAGNYDNVDKKERNEKECWDFKENSDKFVRGIPQGLPQSYFLGNIYMISIAEIFRKKFTGVSYFYVDDSVIFTNDVREDNFKEQLKELNKQIADEANNFEEDSAIYPEGTEKFYKSDLYGVNVHLDGKSNYTRLDNLDDSEVYLKCISREMSQAGSDFFRMYSDEENRNLEEKLDVLSKQVKAKRDQLVEEKSQKRDSGNEDAIEKDEDDTQKFEKRLTRYYRFFEYRKQRLVAMHQPENGSDEDYKKELEKIIYSELSEEDMEDDEKILQAFMNSYGADIWDAAIGMYQTFADDKEQNVLKNYILKINELCYGKASVEFSYLECTYRDLLRNEEENDYSVEEDIFEETLKRYMTEEDLRDIYNDPYKTLGLHTKLYLFDDTYGVLGSANFTAGGFKLNVELSLLLNNDDGILNELHFYFDDLHSKIKQSKEGLITREVLDLAKEKYKYTFSSKKGKGKTTSVFMYGASLDKKTLFENTNDALKEIEKCKLDNDIVDSMFKASEQQEQIIYDHTIWLKFDGEGNARLEAKEGFPMVGVSMNNGIWYLSNYPFKVHSIKDNDEIYFAALTTDVKGKNQPVIVGRGHLVGFTEENYVKDEWVKDNDWMTRYPWYCIIKDSKILDMPIEKGIPMDEIWDKLGSDTYISSFGENESIADVAKKHHQKAHIRLSGNAKEYIDKRLNGLEKQYGVVEYNSNI